MSIPTYSPEWPLCERCGAPNWKVRRETSDDGVETQYFTCSACGHITMQTVIQPDGDGA